VSNLSFDDRDQASLDSWEDAPAAYGERGRSAPEFDGRRRLGQVELTEFE
jgi:hypothetical protein